MFVVVDVLVQQRAYLAHHDAQAHESQCAAGEKREREAVREQRFGDSGGSQQVLEAGEIVHVAGHRCAFFASLVVESDGESFSCRRPKTQAFFSDFEVDCGGFCNWKSRCMDDQW